VKQLNNLNKRRARGFHAERELVKKLISAGIWATRIPVSGIGQALPDVLAAASGKLFGFEVKTAQKFTTYYIRDFDNTLKWLEAMIREGLPAQAFLALKMPNKGWKIIELKREMLSVDPKKMDGIDLDSFLSKIKK